MTIEEENNSTETLPEDYEIQYIPFLYIKGIQERFIIKIMTGVYYEDIN